MKKSLISLNLIVLLTLCTINCFCCADDFFLDGNFSEVKEVPKTPSVQDTKTQALKNQNSIIEKKDSLISKFKKDRKEKQAKNAKSINDMPKGYYGVLPDIYSDFRYKKKTPSTPKDEELKIPTVEELDEEEYREAPYNDTLFLDNIVKKEKTSDYVNNLQKIKYSLTCLKEALENDYDIQRTNAAINMVDLNTQYLQSKYQNQTEALKESYKQIVAVNYYSKVLGNLLYDANYYSRVVPVSDGQYSEDNIKSEKRKLLNKVNKALFLIIEEK